MDLWRCFDKTKNSNQWINAAGTVINKNVWKGTIDLNWHDITQIQGTWTFNANANQTDFSINWVPSAGLQNNLSSTIGDQIVTNTIFFDIGNYTIAITGNKYNNRGIGSIYIGTNLIGTIDEYSASAVFNVTNILTFANTAKANYIIKFIVSGQNASSLGYIFSSSKIIITKV